MGVEGVLDAFADAEVALQLRGGHGWQAADSCHCARVRIEEGGAELPNFYNTRSALRTRGRDAWIYVGEDDRYTYIVHQKSISRVSA